MKQVRIFKTDSSLLANIWIKKARYKILPKNIYVFADKYNFLSYMLVLLYSI